MYQTSGKSYNSYSSRTLLPALMRWSRQPPISFVTEQEREAKGQEREKRKETRYPQMLATLQGSPMAIPEFFEGQGMRQMPNM